MCNAKLFLELVITNPENNEIILVKKDGEKFWSTCRCEIKKGQSFKQTIRNVMKENFSVVGAEIGGVVFLGIFIHQEDTFIIGGENTAYIYVKVIMQKPKKIQTPKYWKAEWFNYKNVPSYINVPTDIFDSLRCSQHLTANNFQLI